MREGRSPSLESDRYDSSFNCGCNDISNNNYNNISNNTDFVAYTE